MYVSTSPVPVNVIPTCLTETNQAAKLLDVNFGDVAQLVEHRTGTPLKQVRFPGAAREFSPGVNF